MANITVTRPDQRVNLGAAGDPPQPEGTTVTITVTLSPSEVDTIAGPGVTDQADRERRCNEFVTDWLSPGLSDLGSWLAAQAKRPRCRACDGFLIGSELAHGTCGQCGHRSVTV